MTAPSLVYLLCVITCLLCAGLLVRAWMTTRVRLLLWSAISFSLLAVNNLFLFADQVLFPNVDLWLFRLVPALAAVVTLIVGFIWESE